MIALTSPTRPVETSGMTMEQLAAMDAAERVRLRLKAISDIERAIESRRAQSGRIDCLQRHLAQLTATNAGIRDSH